MTPLDFLWLFFLLSSLQPLFQQKVLAAQRASALRSLVMAPSGVLGPVDPQLGDLPAASILAAVEKKDVNETDDRTPHPG